MGEVADHLEDHLGGLAGPFLFVGSGLSRRYSGLPDWVGLLRHFADQTAYPLAYYRSTDPDDLPMAATKIAEVFHQVWWDSDDYAESRLRWQNLVRGPASVLKIEVANYLKQQAEAHQLGALEQEELDLLRNAVVEGVITTNYDPLLPHLFDTFRTYVGQDGLLFSDTQGIAEIYMIHGSLDDPSSLVLTDNDYADFNERNAYLAAKLLTIFVEHPVIFLGYSMSDENIRSILQSLARGLREQNIDHLRDRLIFVEWERDAEPAVGESFIMIDDTQLPVLHIRVSNFLEVFKVLTQRERVFPARILRTLKEQLFEIVKSNDPSGRLYALTDIDGKNAENLRFVFGLGAEMTLMGLVGLGRIEIMDDVLGDPDRGLPPAQVIEKVITKSAPNAYFPVFKYLRREGLLTDTGALLDDASVPGRVATRAHSIRERLMGVPAEAQRWTVAELEDEYGWEWILNHALTIHQYTDDLEGLRDFLIQYKHVRRKSWWSTQYAKLVVVYDWLRYGTVDA